MKENENILLDPNLIQIKSLETLEKALGGEIDIPDATNPFIFLLENTSQLIASATQHMEKISRRIYPALATNKKELLQHLDFNEGLNIFATPAKINITFFYNIADIKNEADDLGPMYQFVIPKYSKIVVDNIPFLLMNDVIVRLYKNNKTEVIAEFTNMRGYDKNVLLDSGVITDNNNNQWLIFNMEIPQIELNIIKNNVIKNHSYIKNIKYDNYYYNLISYATSPKLNKVVNVKTIYNQFVFNPDVPSVYVEPFDGILKLEIPPIYILNDLIYGEIEHRLFTTRGVLETDIDIDNSNVSIKYNLDLNTDSKYRNVTKIAVYLKPLTNAYGGKNEIMFEELKDIIIKHSTGDNIIPITDPELYKKLEEYKFTYIGRVDDIIKRKFLVNKDVGNLDTKILSMDLYKAEVIIGKNNITDKIELTNDYLVISPFQIFIHEDGNLRPLTKIERNAVSELIHTNIKDYNQNKYFYNLYKYVIDIKTNDIRIYEYNKPAVEYYRTLYTNHDPSLPDINLGDNEIIKIDENIFKLKVNIKSAIDTNLVDEVGFIMEILNNKNEHIYKLGKLIITPTNKYVEFIIELDNYIDSDDNTIIKSDFGNLDSIKINIENVKARIYCFTKNIESGIVDEYNITNVEFKYVNMLTVIEYNIKPAIRIKHLYSNHIQKFKERKFKKYEKDIYLTYKSDIVETDEDGLPVTIPIDTDGDGKPDDIELVIKHRKGEIVKDNDGKPIILHKKGEIMLDSEGKPIIDYENGVEHSIILTLLEDQYLRLEDELSKEYRINFYNRLTDIINNELDMLNKIMLENTELLYSPVNSIDKVRLKLNNKIFYIDNYVKPKIVLYVKEDSNFELTESVENIIYETIRILLQTDINIRDIEVTLTEFLKDDVISVDITKLVDVEEIKRIVYDEGSSRLVLSKKLTKDQLGSFIIKPDLDIKIVKI